MMNIKEMEWNTTIKKLRIKCNTTMDIRHRDHWNSIEQLKFGIEFTRTIEARMKFCNRTMEIKN